MAVSLGLDIGSNSVGSAWIDHQTGQIIAGVSVFPAGVDESDEKRGDPKNAKRRMTRRTRITLARRAQRKRLLRLNLISEGLLPDNECDFTQLLQETDPWELRCKGLTERLSPHEFGRALLHLAQRRGAMGFDADVGDTGKIKNAIVELQLTMLERFGSPDEVQTQRKLRRRIGAISKDTRTDNEDGGLDAAQEQLTVLCRSLLEKNTVTFGRFIAELRNERRTAITTIDRRNVKKGQREWRRPVRNKAGTFEFHADRAMIRDEFAKLWSAQKRLGGPLAETLTDQLRLTLDDESRDSDWQHKGVLFGQRMQSWDVGTLGRCVLEPTERCAPHADMYASRYLVVQTINDLRIIERGKPKRPLTPDERNGIREYLSGPLGVVMKGKKKGQPKRTVTVTDLREFMGWGRAGATAKFRFSIEADEQREINTDWFSREIIHGVFTPEQWAQLSDNAREGINRAILKHDPDDDAHSKKLKSLIMQDWARLSEAQANMLVAAWKTRPRPDAKRLNMSRRAVRNLLAVMDRHEPWPDPNDPVQSRWLTQIEARKRIADDPGFRDVTNGQPLDERARRRYATGAKGSTARDRHYMKKHLLKKNGDVVFDPSGLPLHEPAPAPLISNPVVRKAIHEVRRHIVEYLTTLGRKPDEVHVELAREAKMGKFDADRVLFKNRLRNRIRNDIAREFHLDSVSSTQRRAATNRVILAVQQRCVCPLCGQTMYNNDCDGITLRKAALGQDCEVAHIVPKGSGGHNGLGNIVLAHMKCNRNMRRRTPREYWQATLEDGFEEGISWIEKMYGSVEHPKAAEVKAATGNSLWSFYFAKRDNLAKIDQFKKDITDIQGMTQRQEAATKYASRQVMAYVADSLFEGHGLPERGGEQSIYANDGLWTSRLRREWGLRFDQHDVRSKGLTIEQEHQRQEKDRGDHRHHAIDAIVIALCTRQVQHAWDEREQQADRDGINTADEQVMDNYRRHHPLPLPTPFQTREEFRTAVKRAVFGSSKDERPVCHRPVKRKLVGALHKETQYGAVMDQWVQDSTVHSEVVRERVTIRQRILGDTPKDFLKPAQLRLPRLETDAEAIERIARRLRIGKERLPTSQAKKTARSRVKSNAFVRAMVDPKPNKGGIVRDVGLRRFLRQQLEERGINPDSYTQAELKKSIDEHGPLTQESGVPIHRVVLLWSNSNPVTIQRDSYDYSTGRRTKLKEPTSFRLYDSQNNHHIEIRARENARGEEMWSGQVVTAFEAAQRKLARLRARRAAGIPSGKELRKIPKDERAKFKEELRQVERSHPLVDRRDNDDDGGSFVMSLCEGEMLLMRHKTTGEVGYFVVAKLNKPQSIVVVPHWDARSATERKDSERKRVPESKREELAITPNDLKNLGPADSRHAVKVRVSPLGSIVVVRDD